MKTLSQQIEELPLKDAIIYLAKYIETQQVYNRAKIEEVKEAIQTLRYDLQEEINRQEEVLVVEAEAPKGRWGCPYLDEQEEV